jgi:hypothetical protein
LYEVVVGRPSPWLSYIYVVVDGAEGAVSVHEVGKEAGVLFEKKKFFLMGKGDQDPTGVFSGAFCIYLSHELWGNSSFIPLIFGYWGYLISHMYAGLYVRAYIMLCIYIQHTYIHIWMMQQLEAFWCM